MTRPTPRNPDGPAMSLLSTEELEKLSSAESLFPSPIPVQSVSSDEFMPAPQTTKQREFEARVKEMGAQMAKRLGMSRRAFFQTAAGMAAAFLAMNDTYGPIFGVSRAEAAEPEHADDRAKKLSGQFIMDMHTHFLRPGTKIMTFVNQRNAVGKAGWNPGLAGKNQTIDDLMFTNYIKEIYLDSDTKVACISGSPSEVPEDWFLTNEMKAQARADVNGLAGTKRMFSHAIFTPGYDGWMEQIDHAISDLKPDSMKGYTIGDNTNKNLSKHPWRMDDEKLVYPAYEKFVKAGPEERLHPQGTVPAVDGEAVSASARVLGRARRRQGCEGLAAAQLHHLSRRLPLRGRRQGRGRVGAVRADRTHRMGHRSLGDSGQVRRQERLRRRRPAVRAIDDRRSARVGGDDRPAHQRHGRGSRLLGHRCHLDRLAAMADRGAAPARDSGGPAEKIRLQAARARRRSGQDGDLRRQQRAPVQLQASAARGARERPARKLQGALRQARRGAHQSRLRLPRAHRVM